MQRLAALALALLAAAAAPARAAGNTVTYSGGPLLRSAKLHLMFWGSYWGTEDGHANAEYFTRFLSAFAASDTFVSEVVEYSTATNPIGPASVISGTTFAALQPKTGDEPETIAFIDAQIDAGKVPPPADGVVYVVFLPPGAAGVPHAEGYHDSVFGDHQYQFISTHFEPYFADGLGVGHDIATTTLSHELAETVTDPWPGAGWTSPKDGQEIGDLCWGHVAVFVAGGWPYMVQQEWSNEHGKCMASRDLSPAGNGCPAGQHRDGDYCVPDQVGCSSTGAPRAALLALVGIALVMRRRRG